MEVMKVATVDKVASYSGSMFFPWNILMEPVDLGAIEYYMPLAVQTAWIKGPYKMDEIHRMIESDVRMVVNDFLLSPTSKGAKEIHGEFADAYPFAYTQALIFARLYATSRDLRLDDLIDLKRIADLIGVDITSFRRREEEIRRLVSIHKKHIKKPRLFTRRILGQKVVSTDGEIIGIVKDVIFDIDTGDLLELVVIPRKGIDRTKFRNIYERKDENGLIQRTAQGLISLLRGLMKRGEDEIIEYEAYLGGISIEDVHVSLYNDYVVFNR